MKKTRVQHVVHFRFAHVGSWCSHFRPPEIMLDFGENPKMWKGKLCLKHFWNCTWFYHHPKWFKSGQVDFGSASYAIDRPGSGNMLMCERLKNKTKHDAQVHFCLHLVQQFYLHIVFLSGTSEHGVYTPCVLRIDHHALGAKEYDLPCRDWRVGWIK